MRSSLPHSSPGCRSDGEPASYRVLEAVARHEETSPDQFDQRLNEVVDPDALDALVRDDETTATVAFTYEGYTVVVHGDGRVSIQGDADGR